MTEHESIKALLALAAAGALDPEEVRRVEQHAQGCDLCRKDLETWGEYAQSLRRLPQPYAPEGLMERTRARLLQQHTAAAAHRRQLWLLGALAIFGWISSLVVWMVVQTVTGGVLIVMGANVVSGLAWSLGSTVLTWTTVAAAALMLGRGRQMRRFL
jgi:anti-sigma factor RsiW